MAKTKLRARSLEDQIRETRSLSVIKIKYMFTEITMNYDWSTVERVDSEPGTDIFGIHRLNNWDLKMTMTYKE